jgi:hypothetical protein
VNVSSVIGSPISDVERTLGKSTETYEVLIGDAEELPDGGESRTYKSGRYEIWITVDKKGIAKGVQVVDGLLDDSYSLDQWPVLLNRLGISVSRAPDVTAPAARRWTNYLGYAIWVAAAKSGGTVWSVRIYKIP